MVQFDLATLPIGFVPTSPNQGSDDVLDSDASASTGRTAATEFLAAGQQNLTLDMGIIALDGQVRIGDYVWEDLNADGVQDAGEWGIADVTVRLFYENGSPTGDVTQTDSDGYYLFSDLPPGDYYVVFDISTLPDGYIISPLNAGDDALDSDADEDSGGRTANTGYLEDGTQQLSLDLGAYRLASLGDYIWEDSDADGIQESGEPPISGVVVRLLDSLGNPVLDGSGNPLTALTDDNGYYHFSNLPPGDYVVMFEAPTGYIASTKDVPSGDAATDDVVDSDAVAEVGSPSYGHSSVVTLISGEHDATIDAGFHRPGSLGNYVWEDLNADGLQGGSEPPVANATINLYDSSGNLVDTTLTDAKRLLWFHWSNAG